MYRRKLTLALATMAATVSVRPRGRRGLPHSTRGVGDFNKCEIRIASASAL
jgi:hypothetical protein